MLYWKNRVLKRLSMQCRVRITCEDHTCQRVSVLCLFNRYIIIFIYGVVYFVCNVLYIRLYTPQTVWLYFVCNVLYIRLYTPQTVWLYFVCNVLYIRLYTPHTVWLYFVCNVLYTSIHYIGPFRLISQRNEDGTSGDNIDPITGYENTHRLSNSQF